MSYLQMPAGISDFSKAVISLWFRVPQESIDKARAQEMATDIEGIESDFNTYFPAIFATIPLVTFGSIEAATTDYGDGSGAYPTSPSFIGVECTRRNPSEKNSLAVHLAMPNTMTFEMTPMVSDGRGNSPEPQFLHSLQRKDAFYMSGKGDIPTGGQSSVLDVNADTWHHVLISFDLSNAARMRYSTAPQSLPPFEPAILMLPDGPTFMWAFDDVDKTDYSLSPSSAQAYNTVLPDSGIIPPSPLPLKQIVTNNLTFVAGGAWAFIATWDPVPIKSADSPIGIPSSALFVENVYRVELAEFQLFTGVTVDTSVETNRRAFIDYVRDAAGNPVKDKDGKLLLRPASSKRAAELLGKKQTVMLQGSSKWKNGKNTGTTGVNQKGEIILDGQFTPTGKIESYRPDPSLEVSPPPPPLP